MHQRSDDGRCRHITVVLAVLKGDKKAIFTAAAKASQAASWLLAHEEGEA